MHIMILLSKRISLGELIAGTTLQSVGRAQPPRVLLAVTGCCLQIVACIFQSSIAVALGLTRVLAVSLMPLAPYVAYLASCRTEEDKEIRKGGREGRAVERTADRKSQKGQEELEEGLEGAVTAV